MKMEKLKILQDIEKVKKAIDDEVDWYIASFTEKDLRKRKIARVIFEEKQKETAKLAKEMYEKYK